MNKTERANSLLKQNKSASVWCDNHSPAEKNGGNCRFVAVILEDEHMICPECKTIYEYWLPDKVNENKTS